MGNKFCLTIENENNGTVNRVRFEVPVIEATNDIKLSSNIGGLIIKALNTGFRNMDRSRLEEEDKDGSQGCCPDSEA